MDQHQTGRRPAHPVAIRVMHWIGVYAMGCMIFSGWEIYNAPPPPVGRASGSRWPMRLRSQMTQAPGRTARAKGAAIDQSLPAPLVDETPKGSGTETLILAGGCFWGVQGVFQHVRGVVDAVSGYDGGAASTAQYEVVSSGTTGHAESVRITYDPHVISYGRLLQI